MEPLRDPNGSGGAKASLLYPRMMFHRPIARIMLAHSPSGARWLHVVSAVLAAIPDCDVNGSYK